MVSLNMKPKKYPKTIKKDKIDKVRLSYFKIQKNSGRDLQLIY